MTHAFSRRLPILLVAVLALASVLALSACNDDHEPTAKPVPTAIPTATPTPTAKPVPTAIPTATPTPMPVTFTGLGIYNDNVFVLPVSEDLAVDGVTTPLLLEEYTKRFYEHFNDEFDFLFVARNLVHGVDVQEAPDRYIGVKNDVQGIGKRVFSIQTVGVLQEDSKV